jgi:hypothetical protein
MEGRAGMTPPLREIILAHCGSEELAARMTAFYDRVDHAIAEHEPVCRNRGDCCDFGRFDHSLYVTTIELAYFAQGCGGQVRMPLSRQCPYQIDGRCSARRHRPLGCRVFYCDEAAREWQGPEYERFQAELKRIGRDLGIDYRYTEWLSALTELGEPVSPQNGAE